MLIQIRLNEGGGEGNFMMGIGSKEAFYQLSLNGILEVRAVDFKKPQRMCLFSLKPKGVYNTQYIPTVLHFKGI